jgi:S1-C subfamily serine protease
MAVDSFSDMAVLKLDGAENLSVASFVSSNDIKPGGKIIAIGRNGSGAQTVFKSGLISRFAAEFSLAGPLASSEKIQGVYFADFDMTNAGDESLLGSAVTNYNGNVVGILSARKTGAAAARQHFVVPVDYVEELTNRFIETGAAQRGSLGVYYQLLTKEKPFRTENSQNFEEGALIFSPSLQQGLAVISAGAADRAGLKIFDVIVSAGGENVTSKQNLARIISKYKAGEEIELKINRGDGEISIKSVLD